MNSKRSYRWLVLSGSLVLLFSVQAFFSVVHAQDMTSNSYRIQFGNFNMTSGEKSSTSYNLTDTVGQTAAHQFSGSGYHVKAGFQYIYPFEAFTFSISKVTINLGTLSYGAFATDTHTLTVSSDGAGGYSVQAQASHPLRLQSGTSTIPDTTCDSGSCTESTAGAWTDASKAGFGFNAAGDDVAVDFADSTYFRQFADLSLAEAAQVIMSGNGVTTDRTATITYQASPQGNQAAGTYETLVTFTAIPSY